MDGPQARMTDMHQVDKKSLLDQICQQLERDLEVLKAAALATYQAATNEESKPENEYDTRGLEASYLAGAQAKRVQEIEEQLTIYKYLEIKSYNESTPIGATALVTVEVDGRQNILFVLPKGGGLSLTSQGHKIQVVTPSSPLGEALIGLRVGDVAVVETGAHVKEYEIIQVS
jgi:transcription elongation GreA/GreB family factor